MQHLSNLSILLIAVLTVSTIALPLTSDEKSKSSQADVSKGQDQIQKSNEKQGRVWIPFGEAAKVRPGRVSRDVNEKSPSISTTEEKQGQKPKKVESKVPESSVSSASSKTQSKPEQKEREGRAWNPFGDATASRRGRFNRDVESSSISSSSEKLTSKTETEKVGEKSKSKSNERQGRSWSPFGRASPSSRGLFNVAPA